TPSGRRLRPDERDALRRRAREKRQLPPEYFGKAPAPPNKRTWPRWGGVALILVAIIIAGNIGLIRGRGGEDDATPGTVAIPSSTVAEVAVVLTSTPENSPTPEPTPTTAPSPTPTPEPTPDPRFEAIVVC